MTDQLRIGGDFPIETALLTASESGQDFPCPKPYGLLVDTGRSALSIILADLLQRGAATTVWCPTFICPSVPQTIRNSGFHIRFYTETPDQQNFSCPRPRTGEVFLFVHYFGFANRPVLDWLQNQAKRDFYTIEDCVQASLSPVLGKTADYCLSSFRKFLPQPDGAWAGSDHPFTVSLASPDEQFVSTVLLGKILKGMDASDQIFLPLLSQAEDCLETFGVPKHISSLSRFVMKRTDFANIALRRRNNWQSLHNRLASLALPGLRPLFQRLGPEDVPLGFPIAIPPAARDRLRAYLKDRRIYCPVHWNLSHVQQDAGTIEHQLSHSILTLPIDQRMDERHLDYLQSGLMGFYGEER